jgi:hypothetical protein
LLRGAKRRQLLNDNTRDEQWTKLDRKGGSDAIPSSMVDVVVKFWTEETRVSPCKKDVRRKKIGVKYFISHATHFLEESQVCSCFSYCNLDSMQGREKKNFIADFRCWYNLCKLFPEAFLLCLAQLDHGSPCLLSQKS